MQNFKYLFLLVLISLVINGCTTVDEQVTLTQNTPYATYGTTSGPISINDNETVTLNAVFADPNGDALTYWWYSSITGGLFSAQNASTTTWRAPDNNNVYTQGTITVRATDTQSNSKEYHIPINMNSSSSSSTVNVVVEDFDQPEIMTPNVTPKAPEAYANVDGGQYVLQWTPVTQFKDNSAIPGGGITSYRIWKAAAESGPFETLATVESTATSYNFTTSAGLGGVAQQLWFKMIAVYTDGSSVAHNSVLSGTFTAVDNSAPGIPGITSLIGNSNGDENIRIYWSANGENDLAGYRVYRSNIYDNTYSLVGESGYEYLIDTTTAADTEYWYRVSAYDFSGNESDMSRRFHCDNISPVDPVGFNAVTGADAGTIGISWNSPGDSSVRYVRAYVSPSTTDYPKLLTYTEGINMAILTGLEEGANYTVTIEFVDEFMNRSHNPASDGPIAAGT